MDAKAEKLISSFEALLSREIEQLKHERAFAGKPGSEAATWQATEAEYIVSLWKDALRDAGFEPSEVSSL